MTERLLVVEDDARIREFLASALSAGQIRL